MPDTPKYKQNIFSCLWGKGWKIIIPKVSLYNGMQNDTEYILTHSRTMSESILANDQSLLNVLKIRQQNTVSWNVNLALNFPVWCFDWMFYFYKQGESAKPNEYELHIIVILLMIFQNDTQGVKHLEPGASYHQSNQALSPLTAFWSDICSSRSFHLKFGWLGKSRMLIPLCGLGLPLGKALRHTSLGLGWAGLQEGREKVNKSSQCQRLSRLSANTSFLQWVTWQTKTYFACF